LQALGRAEVIGETTGGGAHPTRPFPVSAAVHIAIPFARSVNPVTGTNWQATGVIPDTQVPADEAYPAAYAKALRHVTELRDVPPPVADEARAALDALTGVVVPSLVGMPLARAKRKVAEAGLRPEVREQAFAHLPPGTVGAQTPAAGSRVPAEATITLLHTASR
jgi:hypothetical protein